MEMDVALALLLGYPGSPHYQEFAGRRKEQGSIIAPEVDQELCDCLVRAKRNMIGAFSGLFGWADEYAVSPMRSVKDIPILPVGPR